MIYIEYDTKILKRTFNNNKKFFLKDWVANYMSMALFLDDL